MKLEGDATSEASVDVRARLGFARALTEGDLDAAAACFSRDACLITPDATVVHGRDRIRPLLSQLISTRVAIEVEASSLVAGDGVLLAHERWRVTSGSGDGRFARVIHPTLVLRQVEGRWKLAIAAPWGWAEPLR